MPHQPLSFVRFAARHLLLGVLAGIMLCLPGCSLFAESHQQVTLRSNDPNATLFVDGRKVGTGEVTVDLERDENHVFRAETPDGRYATARVRRGVSTTGILDIVGGAIFLVPFLGVLGPGFWSLSDDIVYLDLQPLAPPPAQQPTPQPTQPATQP